MTVLISGAANVARHGQDLYLSHTNVLSLRQWMEAFGVDNSLLILPIGDVAEKPQDMDLLDSSWNVVELLDLAAPFLQRRRQARENLARLDSRSFSMAYVRMPAYEAWWTWKYARKRGIPVLTELHGNWREAFLAQPSRTPLHAVVKRARAWWGHRAFQQMARGSAGVSCIGPALRDQYVPASVPSLVTTNHTVSRLEYRPRESAPENQPPVIVYIGEFQTRKGLHVLFPALRQVLDQGTAFRLLLFGNGPEEARLRALATELGISDRIEFRGYVTNGRDLFDPLHRADLFVLPSIAAEGVPRATHEAMAMGCPVIATDIGSSSWQLRDGAGIVVSPGDAEELGRRIHALLGDRELQRELSSAGMRNALRHTYELQAAGIAEFVSSLMGNRKPGGGVQPAEGIRP